MKNIAIISPSLNSGGAERVAGLLSKMLSPYYNVYLFLLNTKDIVYEYGGTIVNIGNAGPFFEYDIKLNKEKYCIDVAISFLEMMNFANIRSRINEKVIISERCMQSYIEPKAYAEDLQIRRYYNYADALVACSEGVAVEMNKVYGVKIPVVPIYNFISKETITEKAKENLDSEIERFLKDSRYFINIGRLHEQKNQKKLIKQFAVFHANDKVGIKLLILGSGELQEELDRLISELELKNYVKIIAYGSNPFRYLAKAAALVLTSRYEGLPNAVLEAMLLGCPVIASDCMSGPRELLSDDLQYGMECENIKICKRGLLVSNSRTEDMCETTFLAEAMNMILNENVCNDIKNNELEYMKHYDNQAILNRWIEVIEASYKHKDRVVVDEIKQLDKAENIWIYGAGMVGRTCYVRLSNKYKIRGFIVSKKKDGEDELCGLPIYEADDLALTNEHIAVIVGVSYRYRNDIIKKLNDCGTHNIVFPWIVPIK